MDIQALEKLIKERRSIRRWKQQDVPDDLLKKAVELATWAPNGGNFQGWRFVIVKNPAVIGAMADAVQAAADKIASWPEGSQWKEDMARVQKGSTLFKNAPASIAIFVSRYESVMDKILTAREAHDPEAREILSFRRASPTALQSAAAAATTLLLVLQQMGLGAIWLGGPLIAKKQIETLLKVPASYSLACLLAVGHADEAPQRTRKPVEEVLDFIV